MTLDELELINKVIRGKPDSIAYLAAKMVLVERVSQTKACELLNAKPAAVQNGVTRYSDWDLAIRKAYKINTTD